jgi:hypothetical protein
MHPYILQHLATARAKDLREQAAVAQRAREARRARRARRGPGPVLASRDHIRRPGTPRWA